MEAFNLSLTLGQTLTKSYKKKKKIKSNFGPLLMPFSSNTMPKPEFSRKIKKKQEEQVRRRKERRKKEESSNSCTKSDF